MDSRTFSVLLGTAIVLSLLVASPVILKSRWPGIDQGYEPVQPIAFSHRLHAGELEISCLYCHSGAEKSRHAGVPAMSLCMNCHRHVTAPRLAIRAEGRAAEAEGRSPRPIVSPEIQKIYNALGLGANLERDPARTPAEVAWARVHNLPDFTYFDHRPHVSAGVSCQHCHGPVESMERVRQHSTLTMGWCVNCHRTTPSSQAKHAGRTTPTASIDCAVCHH